ncbi:MAG: alpha/beta fold hydrolase, partial [Acidobacteriota bacterium]
MSSFRPAWALVLGGMLAPAVSATELEPCHIPGHSQEVLCGSHTVFEDRAAGSGRQLEIRYAVIPAVDEAAKEDPMVLLPGGPGQAGMDLAPFVELVLSEVNEERDIVLVDQRGMGSSHPLDCDFPEDSLQDMSQDELDQLTRELLQSCLEALDADVTLYTQDLANQDMHEILTKLGYERVNLMGVSWGTRTAQLYAHSYPEQVRTVILDGSLPLRNTAPLYAGADGDRALRRTFEDCAADADCSQAFPQLEADYQQLLDELGEDGVSVTLADPLTGEPATYILTARRFGDALRAILYSPGMSRVLPLIIDRARQGDYRALMG